MLDEAGLEDAIRHYASGFTERTGIEVEVEISPRLGRMTPDVEVALFPGRSRKPHEHPAAFGKSPGRNTN